MYMLRLSDFQFKFHSAVIEMTAMVPEGRRVSWLEKVRRDRPVRTSALEMYISSSPSLCIIKSGGTMLPHSMPTRPFYVLSKVRRYTLPVSISLIRTVLYAFYSFLISLDSRAVSNFWRWPQICFLSPRCWSFGSNCVDICKSVLLSSAAMNVLVPCSIPKQSGYISWPFGSGLSLDL